MEHGRNSEWPLLDMAGLDPMWMSGFSPFAKRHFIDHTPYDTMSLLKLMEKRWGLMPLGGPDAHATDLTNALKLQ
jgi:hypothetical protein